MSLLKRPRVDVTPRRLQRHHRVMDARALGFTRDSHAVMIALADAQSLNVDADGTCFDKCDKHPRRH
jgi:hypothetical protein